MPTLLDIAGDVKALEALLEESGGEVTPENTEAIEFFFASIGQAQEEKIDNYAALIKLREGYASVRRAEMDRLAMAVKADENLVRWLKDRLQLFMEMTGQPKIETRRYKLRVQANGGKVPVEVTCDPALLPAPYQRVRIEPDMDAIRAALAAGEEIDGVTMGSRGSHLRIA